MSASMCTRQPSSLPSASAASSIFCFCPRPWWVEPAASDRVSVQRTARPSFVASDTARISSGLMLSLAPNPPPTDGAMTRIFDSGMPVVAATITLRMCGTWVAL